MVAVESVQPETGVTEPTHVDVTPFNVKSSNSTAPLENWNLTDLLNETAGTVTLFAPRASATGLAKNQLPLAVVFATLTFAPPAGKFVIFIVKVCAP